MTALHRIEEQRITRSRPVERHHRTRFWRSKRGRRRRWAMPTVRSPTLRSNGIRPGTFDSGAVADPSRLSVRIAPNTRERSGTPCSSW